MISAFQKPHPIAIGPLPFPKPKRLPKGTLPMTLVAAFRCHRGGLLLCADREENYGDVKREIDKICEINLPSLQVFIAGTGPSSVINQTCLEFRHAMTLAFAEGKDMAREHKPLMEDTLKSIHKHYAANLKHWPLGLIVVFAPYDRSMVPLLYRTELSMMVSEPLYVGYGAGKALCDYLADFGLQCLPLLRRSLRRTMNFSPRIKCILPKHKMIPG
jgi:hypothetical protein